MLVLHYTIIKHKAALDHLRKGLSILDLLKEIENKPEIFEPLFVHSGESVSSTFVKSLLNLPDTTTTDQVAKNAVEMLLEFIECASEDELLDFLSFTTGSKLKSGGIRPKCIFVSVENMQGFFASTCSFELKLPARVTDYGQFQILLKSVIKGFRFTTV